MQAQQRNILRQAAVIIVRVKFLFGVRNIPAHPISGIFNCITGIVDHSAVPFLCDRPLDHRTKQLISGLRIIVLPPS